MTAELSMNVPSSLARPISPPLNRVRQRSETTAAPKSDAASHKPSSSPSSSPSLAAIEAGTAKIRDHLSYFLHHLSASLRPTVFSSSHTPQLSLPAFKRLYERNQHPHGHHFVIHQHDHPVAGVHYDLRLQFSETSSVSWAIMYGLPGNPNSRRWMRQATETRVHNVWNHLIESGSHATGSLLIWDTGEYSVLPYRSSREPVDSEPELSGSADDGHHCAQDRTPRHENEKLMEAFHNVNFLSSRQHLTTPVSNTKSQRKIRLRLHGTRLPPSYTISLRLPSYSNIDAKDPNRPIRKRRRKEAPPKPSVTTVRALSPLPSSQENPSTVQSPSPPPASTTVNQETPISAPKDTDSSDAEALFTRLTNAYPGATNSINSESQRKWFLSLDRAGSGFRPQKCLRPGKTTWVRGRRRDGSQAGFEPFVVRGREVERSVVTRRRAAEVMEDEGVVGYQGRGGWRAVVE
ncbi:MAG: hypothetical protein M1817_000088 [Caeruleum heppii]|nr:MAG: hypothetical protein M1817_000088 [Caeruleum heppii]